MQIVGIKHAQEHLSELVDAAIQGENIVIQRNEQYTVQLVPNCKTKNAPQFGSAKGLIEISDDFDEPLEDFSDYMK